MIWVDSGVGYHDISIFAEATAATKAGEAKVAIEAGEVTNPMMRGVVPEQAPGRKR